ncbi:MAG TPA: UDP-3-O-(3-hydroxymyristoyl)glucosamine N-acyltransferase [Bacteroidales bacterium]|nr:UDP-3-O-(3-hydroxymyristoyl)glucosamine N-acyltransferase [Bacteroidales bacterium]
MKFTAFQIAELIGATIEGNPDTEIKSFCRIEEGIPGALSFLANPKYTHYIYQTKASAVIVSDDFVPEEKLTTTLIRTKNPYAAIAQLMAIYEEMMKPKKIGISEKAHIDPTAQIGKDVYIAEFVSVGEGAVIGDCAQLYPHTVIGDRGAVGEKSVLYAGVKVYRDCKIGKECIIHAGVVIGADGFGFAPQDGQYLKVPQIGNVIIEDYVEIGANTCIDRATIGSTIIHSHVKLDNLIQVAHNVELGEGTACAAQVGISGSTKIGKKGIIAGQVGITGHLHIGDNVIIGAQSGVMTNIEDKQIVLGSPAIPVSEEKKLIIYRKKLPDLYKQVRELWKKYQEDE